MATTTKKSSNGAAKTAQGKKPGARMDAVALLKQDHRTVEALFKQYKNLTPTANKSRARLIDKIVKELSVHAAVEEQILYPTTESESRGSKRLVSHSLDEHQAVKETLAELQKLDAGDERADELMRALMSEVRSHVKEEETQLFPKLRAAVGKDVLVQMGTLMQLAKKTAPTRPHPHAPNKPPGNIVIGMASGAVDRARDAGRGVRRKVTGT
ncbi:MAG TPA: hemerythrin domain-containing protein [Actinomycetota bacterium]|nr:hemerythrin domain-containing protein [Actinomycetota bacterium]